MGNWYEKFTSARVMADSTCVHLCGSDEIVKLILFCASCCSLPIGRSVGFALGSYSLPLDSLICRNRTGRHVGVPFLAVNHDVFELLDCQYALFTFLPFTVLAFLLFSSLLLLSLDANDVCEHLNKIVDEHTLPTRSQMMHASVWTRMWTNTPSSKDRK